MTREEKDDGGVHFTNGVGTRVDASNVTTPTEAELIAAFGPASKNAGKVFIQDDNGAGTTIKIVVCTGTKYAFAALTVAS
jgi:hypothetical protein